MSLDSTIFTLLQVFFTLSKGLHPAFAQTTRILLSWLNFYYNQSLTLIHNYFFQLLQLLYVYFTSDVVAPTLTS